MLNSREMDEHTNIQENLSQVRNRIAAAARRGGRSPDDVRLVAVTKTHPPEVAAAAFEAGLTDLGENRVGEAADKIPAVQELISPAEGPRWHMVGHLQRRKAGPAIELFDLIHSLDSVRLAERINRLIEREESDLVVPVLMQVNVSGERSKYGFDLPPSASPKDRADFWQAVEQILALPHLRPQGLMTMAPLVTDPERTRPVFYALRELRDELRRNFPQADWHELSMGMTDDFEVAIEEGATIVRIGRAIFGSRTTCQV